MIFITGCARSGSSLVAGIVDRCGAWGGNVEGPTRFNPKGQYENLEIRRKIVKPILKMASADPMGQQPLPSGTNLMKMLNGFPAETRRSMDNIIKKQGYKGPMPWYAKEPKFTLIWPILMRAYPEALYIIVHRPDHLIIKSCMRTSFMRKRTTEDEWQEWINFHKTRFDEMESFGNVHRVNSLAIVKGNFNKIKSVIEKAGLTWNQSAVEQFVDKKIWNTKK